MMMPMPMRRKCRFTPDRHLDTSAGANHCFWTEPHTAEKYTGEKHTAVHWREVHCSALGLFHCFQTEPHTAATELVRYTELPQYLSCASPVPLQCTVPLSILRFSLPSQEVVRLKCSAVQRQAGIILLAVNRAGCGAATTLIPPITNQHQPTSRCMHDPCIIHVAVAHNPYV